VNLLSFIKLNRKENTMDLTKLSTDELRSLQEDVSLEIKTRTQLPKKEANAFQKKLCHLQETVVKGEVTLTVPFEVYFGRDYEGNYYVDPQLASYDIDDYGLQKAVESHQEVKEKFKEVKEGYKQLLKELRGLAKEHGLDFEVLKTGFYL
jgi:hypothetical protein